MAQSTSVSGILVTDRRDFYVEPRTVAHLRPGATPFLSTILMMNGVKKVPEGDFKMFEDDDDWYEAYFDVNDSPSAWSTPAGGSAGDPGATVTVACDGATGLAIDSSLVGRDFVIYDSTLATKKGNVTCTAVSGSNVTFKNTGGLATSSSFAVSALADNDRFFDVGSAFGEGSDAPDAYTRALSTVWNSCQDHKTSVQITTFVKNLTLRGDPSELIALRENRLAFHKMGKDRASWLSVRPGGIGGVAHGAGGGTDSTFTDHQTDADGNLVRKTMGILPILERYGISDDTDDHQNVFNRTFNDYDYAQFVEDADKSLQYDPNGEMATCWCGNKVINFFATAAMATNSGWEIKIDTAISALGFEYSIVRTGRARFRLIEVPWWRKHHGGHMVRLDPQNVQPVHFEEANQYSTNIKTDNKPRIQKDEFYSNLGLKFKQVKRSSLWKFT